MGALAAQPGPIVLTGETRTAKVREITEKLEDGIRAIFDSDAYRAYLDTMAKFHRYSFGNTILIWLQRPDASLVAGYNDWKKKHHRHVKEHEKGIKILAPIVSKRKKSEDAESGQNADQQQDEKDEMPPVVSTFKVVTVFDVSQTEGEPLPSYGVDELTGDVEQYNAFMSALESVSPAPIRYEDIPGGAHGYYSHTTRSIAIQDGMSQLQTLKTGIHEVAHAVLHAWPEDGKRPTNGPDRHTKEVQAESVAYTVCQHYGLDTSDYSFAYVAGWSTGRELPELKASMETIRTAAHDLIDAIDAKLCKEVSA